MAKVVPLILFTVLANAAAQTILKKGMIRVGTFPFGVVSLAYMEAAAYAFFVFEEGVGSRASRGSPSTALEPYP